MSSYKPPLVQTALGRKADTMPPTRCMIVEDQALIGMSLEASLEEAGFAVEGPFISNAQALNWLESNVPDVALLDVMIQDGSCLQIARALKNSGIPFAVYSGLPPKADCPPELQNVPWIEKPVSRETLAAILTELMAQRQSSTAAASEVCIGGREASAG